MPFTSKPAAAWRSSLQAVFNNITLRQTLRDKIKTLNNTLLSKATCSELVFVEIYAIDINDHVRRWGLLVQGHYLTSRSITVTTAGRVLAKLSS